MDRFLSKRLTREIEFYTLMNLIWVEEAFYRLINIYYRVFIYLLDINLCNWEIDEIDQNFNKCIEKLQKLFKEAPNHEKYSYFEEKITQMENIVLFYSFL
jgi:hypothetical protein